MVMRQASRYSIGGRPTVRVKRSKNAERESPAGKRALLLDALEGLVEPGHPSPMVPASLRRRRRLRRSS